MFSSWKIGLWSGQPVMGGGKAKGAQLELE